MIATEGRRIALSLKLHMQKAEPQMCLSDSEAEQTKWKTFSFLFMRLVEY